MMTEAQKSLKADIEKINDDLTIEKIKIFIMGILAQQGLEKTKPLESEADNKKH